jgi:DNA-binding GntR family transcriptional regulator
LAGKLEDAPRKRVTTRSTSLPRPRRAASADEKVYEAIFDAVQGHRLAPGVKLKEVELTRLFSVSRASVRSALRRLSHIGVVDIAPHKGAMVASLSAQDCRELMDARRGIEAAVVEQLIRAASPATILRLRDHVQAQKTAFGAGDRQEGQRLAIGFHRLLAQLCGNRLLAAFMDQVLARMPLVVLTMGGRATSEATHAEHIELVEAIAARDLERARAILLAHLHNVQREIENGELVAEPTLAEMLRVRSGAK